jgi:S1-C subfamily serine protease
MNAQPVDRRTARRIIFVLVVALVAAAAVAGLAFAQSTASIGTGVVTITTRLGYENGQAAGTGMVLTSSGEVLTNNHVIAGATTITVAVPGTGHRYSAHVVGYDVRDDVAVLELQGASNLKTVTPASSKSAAGEKVTAVGNAGGTGSLSSAAGRITGTGKTITAASDTNGGSETLVGLIETNAGVVAGDSGGPLLDANHKVVGMITAAASIGTLGFQNVSASDAYAIPIGRAASIANAVEAGKSSATIHVGATAFLGIQVASADSLPSGFGNGGSAPVIVSVVSGGPAASAGLEPGDVITSVGGRAAASPSAVSAIVLTTKPGATLAIRYIDTTGAHTVTVRLGSGPAQ